LVSRGNATLQALKVVDLSLEERGEAENSIEQIDSALEKVNAERSKYGVYQNVLEHTYNNVVNYSENLVQAESRIADVDMAEEIMKLTKQKILLQASSSLLMQANKDAQSVMELISM
jgi:flagellin